MSARHSSHEPLIRTANWEDSALRLLNQSYPQRVSGLPPQKIIVMQRQARHVPVDAFELKHEIAIHCFSAVKQLLAWETRYSVLESRNFESLTGPVVRPINKPTHFFLRPANLAYSAFQSANHAACDGVSLLVHARGVSEQLQLLLNDERRS